MKRHPELTKAARHAARQLLKDTPYCPDIEFIDATTSAVSCDRVATQAGFEVRLDGQISAGTITQRIYHAAAHLACNTEGVRGHNAAGRHNKTFEHALEGVAAQGYDTLNKSQKAAIQGLLQAYNRIVRARAPRDRNAYSRVQLTCPEAGCRTTLTIRETAAEKVAVTCVLHARLLDR